MDTHDPFVDVITDLKKAAKAAKVSVVVLAQLVGIEYITLDKYLRKERSLRDDLIARRMMVTTDLLNELVAQGKLPVLPETNRRLRSGVILATVDQHLNDKLNH